MFSNFRDYVRHSFFLLGLFPLSNSVSLFRHISFTFISLFLHHSLLRMSCIISRHLIILESTCFLETYTSPNLFYISTLSCLAQGQRLELWLVTLLPAPSFSPRVENLQWLYNFPDADAVLVVTLPSRMSSRNSRGISAVFCLRHVCNPAVWPVIYVVRQRNLLSVEI